MHGRTRIRSYNASFIPSLTINQIREHFSKITTMVKKNPQLNIGIAATIVLINCIIMIIVISIIIIR